MTLLWTLGQATVVLALVALADALLRRRTSAAGRHWHWTLALAALVLLPAVSRVVPGWDVPVVRATSVAPSMDAAPVVSLTTPVTVAARITNEGTLPAHVASGRISPASSFLGAVSPAAVLWTIYLAGVVVLFWRMTIAHRAARALVASGEPIDDPRWGALLRHSSRALGCTREVTLIRSEECAMPMAIGTRHPTIVVPSFADEWTDDRREAVLLHELAHIARRDCLTQTFASIATALYWPHPGVWWAAARLRAERELACDDRVISAGSPARDYASHLLEIAHALGRRRVPALGVTMARPNQLEGRLLAVIDDTRNRRTPTGGQQTLVVAIAAALLLPVAALRAVPAAPAPAGLTTLGDHSIAPQSPAQNKSQSAPRMAGTWELRPWTDNSSITSVHLRMTDGNSSNGHSFQLSALEGMSADTLTSAGASDVHFTLKRDAGTFTFDGRCANRACAGTFAYVASATFAGELAKRGIARPTELQQYEMARNDVQLALVDELKSQGYATPTIDDLVRAGQHGVTFDYVRDFGALGYKVGQVAALVNMRDHGVTPDETRALGALGLTKLSADELVRVRDHGVTSDYIKAVQELGYRSLTVDQLVTARDHGVTPDFVRGIRGFGYNDVTLEGLILARDHGVDPTYIKSMTDVGYGKQTLEMYIRMRDHGVTADWARRVTSSGGRLDADELIRRRDRGGN